MCDIVAYAYLWIIWFRVEGGRSGGVCGYNLRTFQASKVEQSNSSIKHSTITHLVPTQSRRSKWPQTLPTKSPFPISNLLTKLQQIYPQYQRWQRTWEKALFKKLYALQRQQKSLSINVWKGPESLPIRESWGILWCLSSYLSQSITTYRKTSLATSTHWSRILNTRLT